MLYADWSNVRSGHAIIVMNIECKKRTWVITQASWSAVYFFFSCALFPVVLL